MAELVQANWILLVVALVIGILVAWWIFVRSRRTRVEIEEADEAPAKSRRNQALIDAPPAAATAPAARDVTARDVEEAERVMPPTAPMGLAGAGEAVEAAAQPAPVPESDASPYADAVPPPSPPPPAPAAPSPEPPTAEGRDDLSRIKGLGSKLQAQLQELGVTSFAQIAAWDEAEIDRIDAQLGRFEGRIRRDNWPEQARLLAAGDMAGYEERFGKL